MNPTNKSTIEIDFIVRSDSEQKAGGDTHQTQQYINELNALGYDCRLVPIRIGMKLRPNALIHVINIDRPFDFLYVANELSTQKLFVSTIHHNLEYVRRMRKAERDYGLRSFIGRNTSESTREWLAFGVRQMSLCRSGKDYLSLIAFLLKQVKGLKNVWIKIGKILDEASAVFILANGEGRSLRIDTKCSGDNFVLTPNGIPQASKPSRPKKWQERTIPIVVVGRIEPRKRQLDIAIAANKLRIPICFAGQVSNPNSKYIQAFESEIENSTNLQWLGALKHDKTIELLQDSKVLLNFSWVEVQSLVDIEAATQGCLVVANNGGNSKEWLGDTVAIPQDTTAETAILKAYELSKRLNNSSNNFVYEQSWKNTVRIIVNSYIAALFS